MTDLMEPISRVSPFTPGLTSETAVPPGYTDVGPGRFTAQETERARELGISIPGAELGEYMAGLRGHVTGQPTTPEPLIDTETLDKQYGIPGYLKFNNPLPASVAQGMNQERRDEILREARAQAAPGGFFSGVARIGVDMANQMLDPLGAAAALVPVVGEARLAGLFARAGLEAGAARFAGRLAAAGLSGAVGTAPLAALQYGLQTSETRDFTMMDAAGEMLLGGLTFGALHASVGHFFGHSFDIPGLTPEIQEGAARATSAAIMEDRPVDVANYIRLSGERSPERINETLADIRRSPTVLQALGKEPPAGVAETMREAEAAAAKPVSAEPEMPSPEEMAPLEAWAKQVREPPEAAKPEAREPSAAAEEVKPLLAETLLPHEHAELAALDEAKVNTESDATALQAAAQCIGTIT